MFGRNPSPALQDLDDPHLEVTVTPSQSAFYAGEVFSAVITLRNTRTPVRTPRGQASSPAPNRPEHLHLLTGASTVDLNGETTPTSPTPGSVDGGTPGSSGYADWRGHARKSSHGSRRAQSLALGKGISPQEMLWALGDAQTQPPVPVTPIGPPPLPARRAGTIPKEHPHARQISVASTAAFNSPPVRAQSLPDDSSPAPDMGAFDSSAEAGPSRATANASPSRVTPSASPSLADVAEEFPSREYPSASSPGATTPTSPTYSNTSPSHSGSGSPARGPIRPLHERSPSYHNAYGTSLLTPPPVHPQRRTPLQPGVTTVLWGTTRLVARFSPGHQYIPPDPLLPLRARLLHQPIGSGSLSPQTGDKPSRWSLNFGTGTIGHSTQPSLTGSLFGLAKGLVLGGTGGTLEEERKRVWSTQDLPVLETARSLMGVDIKLQEGETREYLYTIQLPSTLPPAFKGKALRFSYELVVSLNVALPGGGKRQRTKEIAVPVRVWPNVSLDNKLLTYDVLSPVIQTTETGSIVEREPTLQTRPRRSQHMHEPPQSIDSLATYAQMLVDMAESPAVPPSPSKTFTPLEPPLRATAKQNLLMPDPLRPRSASLVGDDELVEQAPRCGEAVEILSRHSARASYDIRQEGEVVAVLTLIKTTYRLGETVLGVVTFNEHPERRVLKLNAYLETHEVIPEALLPPSASSSGRARQPELRRMHAEQRTAYAQFTQRTAFSLDIPSDATPAFSLDASGEEVGQGAKRGGLEWRVRLAFLVASPPRRKSMDARAHARRSESGTASGAEKPRSSTGSASSAAAGANMPHAGEQSPDTKCLQLIPLEGDADSTPYVAGPGLAPYVQVRDGWVEARAETVECEVPVQVLAGNTAFVVRPGVYTV